MQPAAPHLKIADITDAIHKEAGELNGIDKNITKVRDFKTLTNLEDFEPYRITKEKDIPETFPVITIGDAKVAAPKNITPITAEGKGGKTALRSVFLAGAISKNGEIDGFPEIKVKPNPDGKAVVDFDTEQSESDHQHNVKNILVRAGFKHTPDNYRSYNIRTLPLNHYKDFLNTVCDLCSDQFNGIHMIVIDGGADFINSVNDEAEANGIIAYFTQLADKHDAPVIVIIHLNENAGKNNDTMPRGHFGRQAVRKGYCQLNITKEDDTSTLQVLRARHAGNNIPLVHYKWSDEKGYHVSTEAVQNSLNEEREMQQFNKMKSIAEKIFEPPLSFSHTDAIDKMIKQLKKSKPTVKRYLNDMLDWDLVERSAEGFYMKKLEKS